MDIAKGQQNYLKKSAPLEKLKRVYHPKIPIKDRNQNDGDFIKVTKVRNSVRERKTNKSVEYDPRLRKKLINLTHYRMNSIINVSPLLPPQYPNRKNGHRTTLEQYETSQLQSLLLFKTDSKFKEEKNNKKNSIVTPQSQNATRKIMNRICLPHTNKLDNESDSVKKEDNSVNIKKSVFSKVIPNFEKLDEIVVPNTREYKTSMAQYGEAGSNRSKSEKVEALSTAKPIAQDSCQREIDDLLAARRKDQHSPENATKEDKIVEQKTNALDRMEQMLRHMLEKHKPIATTDKLGINEYKKGIRESINFPDINRNKLALMEQKERDGYLQNQIQYCKEQYMESIERKLNQIDINRPLKSRKIKVRRQHRDGRLKSMCLKKSFACNSTTRNPVETSQEQTIQKLEKSRESKQLMYQILDEEKSSTAKRVETVKPKIKYGHLKAAISMKFSQPTTKKVEETAIVVVAKDEELIPEEIAKTSYIDEIKYDDIETNNLSVSNRPRKGNILKEIKGKMKDLDDGEKEVESRIEKLHSIVKQLTKPKVARHKKIG